MTDLIKISITPDEALVVFDWLSELRFEGPGDAERIALDAIVTGLEQRLTAPFEPNYATLLGAARKRLTERP